MAYLGYVYQQSAEQLNRINGKAAMVLYVFVLARVLSLNHNAVLTMHCRKIIM